MIPPKRIKKHVSQMTQAELSAIGLRVSAIKPVLDTERNYHLKLRLNQKGIWDTEIYKAIEQGKIIEANTDGRDLRVVLRHTSVAVVVSLHDGAVVTAWKNNPLDTHKTLDIRNYTWYKPIPKELLCTR